MNSWYITTAYCSESPLFLNLYKTHFNPAKIIKYTFQIRKYKVLCMLFQRFLFDLSLGAYTNVITKLPVVHQGKKTGWSKSSKFKQELHICSYCKEMLAVAWLFVFKIGVWCVTCYGKIFVLVLFLENLWLIKHEKVFREHSNTTFSLKVSSIYTCVHFFDINCHIHS